MKFLNIIFFRHINKLVHVKNLKKKIIKILKRIPSDK